MGRASNGKPMGFCLVCKGNIVETIVTRAESGGVFGSRQVVYGGPPLRIPTHDVVDGFHCSNCGIKYEFVRDRISKLRKHRKSLKDS